MEATYGIAGEPSGSPGGRSGRAGLALLGVVLGAAGFAGCLALVYTAMRKLMETTGGFCASGGPYQIASGHHCDGGQVGLLIGGILGMLVFGALFAGTAGARDGGLSGMDAGFLMWFALFGVLGLNFLTLGISPPPHVSGGGGWIISGVVFELMALGGLVPLFWSVREWAKRGGGPEPPLFKGPQVRAAVRPTPAAGPGAAEPPKPAAPLPKSLNIPKRDWDKGS